MKKEIEVNELDYNTQLEKLRMPEYGRNIQRMVDYLLTLEDRDERNKCARTIIAIMGNSFPHLREIPDFKQKLWNHLAIMADFQLDVDFPYEIVKKQTLMSHPDRVPYSNSNVKVKHYGRLIEDIVSIASSMEDGDERDRLIEMLANQMKKSLISWNRESVDDQKVFDDLRKISGGKIDVGGEKVRLIEVRDVPGNRKQYKNQSNNRKNQK